MHRSSDPRPIANLLTPVDTEKRDAERETKRATMHRFKGK